ncbi:oxaloacetate carrier [Moniliophthora roreri]|nr:oxaloacetate carrier [Moniliophthora roreri]
MRRGLNRAANLSPSEQNMATSVIAGASTGAIGATLGNPMFLIKARMQAYSPALPVGTQHYYRNSIHALSSIIREEGLRGLLRGTSAAVLRTASGSSVQVPSYVWAKGQFVKHGILPADSFWTFLASSSVSGLVALAAMQPTDTVLTRMYNQPVKVLPNGKHVGVLYKNPIDALIKIAKTEGPLGWYKGNADLTSAPTSMLSLFRRFFRSFPPLHPPHNYDTHLQRSNNRSIPKVTMIPISSFLQNRHR